jgi:hypothetical protein
MVANLSGAKKPLLFRGGVGVENTTAGTPSSNGLTHPNPSLKREGL